MSQQVINLETCNFKTFKKFLDTLDRKWAFLISTNGIDMIRHNLFDRYSNYGNNASNDAAIKQFQKRVDQIAPKPVYDVVYYNRQCTIWYNITSKTAFIMQKPDKFFTRKFT